MGLTHRRWGQHINRYQTWWNMSKPYFEYVARFQALLQKGRRVVDVACMYTEGAPLNAEWKDWETLVEWPDWFQEGEESPAGRYTFTTARHYQKDSSLMPAGLLGPVKIMSGK